MNQPNTVDFDAADGMGSAQVTINTTNIVTFHNVVMFIIVLAVIIADMIFFPSGHRIDPWPA